MARGPQRPVGELPRRWREQRRLSQLALSILADVSTRHLSFVETGRSLPSRDLILHLADQLDGWTMVDANATISLFLAGVAPDLLEPPVNVLRLSLHPEGMARQIVNLGEWRAHLLGRLRRQLTLTADGDLADLYAELRSYPCEQPEPPVELPGPGDVVVPLRVRHADAELSFFSTVAAFGTPLDITVAELAIESFFPADPETASALHATGRRPAP